MSRERGLGIVMATAAPTEGSSRRAVLAALEHALSRELQVLTTFDLAVFPTLLWQQLHNRLQWDAAAPKAWLVAQRERRSRPDSAPWLRLLFGRPEMQPTIRTFTARGPSVRACRWAERGTALVSHQMEGCAGLTGTATVWSVAEGRELRRFDRVLAVLGARDADGVIVAELTEEDEGADGALRLHDALSGRRLATLTPLESLPITCALARDGATAFISDGEEHATIWDLRTGRRLHELPGSYGYEQEAAWTSDGRFVVLSATSDRLDKSCVQIYEAATGKLVYRFREDLSGALVPLPFAISPDGEYVAHAAQVDGTGARDAQGGRATGEAGSRVVVWSTSERRVAACCAGFTGAVRHCAFSPDGRLLACTADEPAVRLFDPAGGAQIATLDCGSTDGALAWTPSGARLAVARDDAGVGIWDVAHAREVTRITGLDSRATALAFSPDGSALVVGEAEGALKQWPVPHESPLAPVGGTRAPAAISASNDDQPATTAVSFSPDGSRLMSGDAGGGITLLDTAAGIASPRWQAHAATVGACAFAPRGDLILTAAANGELRLWRAGTRTTLRTLQGHEAGVTVCAFSPDGARIASGDEAGFVRVWSTEPGQPPTAYTDHIDCYRPAVTALAFSPDGTTLASAARNRSRDILVREMSDGRIVATLSGSTFHVTALVLSADRRLLVTGGGGGEVRLWGVRTAVELARLRRGRPGEPEVARCAFSGDERYIVCTDRYGQTTAWDTATARRVNVAAASPAPFGLSTDRETCVELTFIGAAKPVAVLPTRTEPQRAEIGPSGTTMTCLDWSGNLSVLRICGGLVSGTR